MAGRTAPVVIFRDEDGRCPFVEWFNALPGRVKVQCRARLGLLADQGHQLRRPAADYLRDGIYELRVKADRIQYRVLYFFHGRAAVVISHGIMKQEALVPTAEIERARQRKRVFEADPRRHTFKEPL